MFGFAMGKVWNTFWSRIKFPRVRIETNLEGDSYWFDILWVKRGKEFLGSGEFSSKTLLLQKYLGSWFWLGTYFKSFGEGGVGGFVDDNVYQWWQEELAFLNWMEISTSKEISHTLWWKQIGGYISDIFTIMWTKTVWELNCQSDLFLLKLIETISSWQVIHQH